MTTPKGMHVLDVVSYQPDPSRHDPNWCREGTAIVREVAPDLRVADTYWRSGAETHMLSAEEIATAKFLFNLNDYRPIERGEVWADFHTNDRAVVTSQHRLQRSEYVRHGAEPDHGMRVKNAHTRVEDRQYELERAEQALRWAREDLARLLETAATS